MMSLKDKDTKDCSESNNNNNITTNNNNCNHDNGNKKEDNNKTNNRTHHTRFFEKLYGNLEHSSETKIIPQTDRKIINSPSESSGSSSSDNNLTRWIVVDISEIMQKYFDFI